MAIQVRVAFVSLQVKNIVPENTSFVNQEKAKKVTKVAGR